MKRFTKEDLISVIEGSTSHSIMKQIVQNMKGGTVHHLTHILYDLRTLLGEEKKSYFEIGALNGATTCLMLLHPFMTDVESMDIFNLNQSQIDVFIENVNKFNVFNRKMGVFKGLSTSVAMKQRVIDEGIKTDILLIDGDQSYYTVIQDFDNFSDLVNTYGFIVFNMYNDHIYSPEVKTAVDNIVKRLDCYQYNVIGCIRNIKKAYSNYTEGINDGMCFVIQKIC